MVIRDILFDYDRSDIRDGESTKVQQLADYAKQNEGVTIMLHGFADPRGSDKYNVALSQRRVNAVRDALVQAGVPAERIGTAAFGEQQLKCDAATEECYQAARRVEVFFGTDSGTAAASPRGPR